MCILYKYSYSMPFWFMFDYCTVHKRLGFGRYVVIFSGGTDSWNLILKKNLNLESAEIPLNILWALIWKIIKYL